MSAGLTSDWGQDPRQTGYDDLFQQAGAQNGVDPLWLKAQAMAESSLDPNAVNDQTGAAGISQITPDTAQRLGVDPKDPASAIAGQARLMAENQKRYGSIENATLAYHGGTDKANWGPKTHAYLQKVSANYNQLKENKAMVDPADQFLEIDGAGPKKVDQGVEDFLNAETPMGPAKAAAAPQAAQSAPTIASQAGPSAPVVPDASPPTASLVPQKTADVQRALDYLNDPRAKGIVGLKNDDPAAYAAFSDYVGKNNKNALSELGTGIMDVPVSLAKAGMSVADMIHDHITNRGDTPSNYGDVMDQYIKSRNALYNSSYGADPDQGFLRGAGQLVGSAPAFGAAGMGANALKTALPAVGPVADFISGTTSRFADEGASGLAKAGQYIKGLASKMTGGAVAGEGVTALTNAGSDESYNDQRKSNDLFGAGLNAGGSVVKDVAKGVGGIAKNAYNSLTGAGIKELPAKAIDAFATAPIDPANLDTREIVPGSTPSLAAATQDPGIAELQRQVENTDPSLVKLAKDNNMARLAHIEEASGTPQDLEKAISDREGQRDADTATLWQPGQVADPQPVLAKIDEILSGPAGKRPAVSRPLNNIKDLINQKDADGNIVPITDPQTLYESVRKHIGDLLDNGNPESRAFKSAQEQLRDVQGVLDQQIDKAAPGFQNYMDNYANASSKIDGMRYMQNLNLTDGKGNLTLNKVNKAIDNITKLQASPGLNDAKHVTDEQLQSLKNVQADMQRDAIVQTSMPKGSPTEQNRKASVRLNNILPGNHDPMSGKLNPEVVGSTIGAGLGSMVGLPRTGMVIGDVLARAGGRANETRRAAVQNELGLTLANPSRYQPSASGYTAGGAGIADNSLLNSSIPHITITKNALAGSSGGQ